MLSARKTNSENGPLAAGQALTTSGPTTARFTQDGFELFVLRNANLELAVVPARALGLFRSGTCTADANGCGTRRPA